MNPEALLAALLGLAVVGAWARLWWWQRNAEPAARSRGWRVATLAAAQPVGALLLYLTLYPPARGSSDGGLVVATAGTPRVVVAGAGDTLVALPEAEAVGAEPVPDLATALRRHPGARSIRIVGAGLPPRDRDAARGRPIAFDPPALPRGIVAVETPPPVAPGAGFRVGGRVAGAAGATVELIDPAGRRVDAEPVAADGGFVVDGTARVPGATLFTLRLRAGGQTIDDAIVPVTTERGAPLRVLLLAGAPTAEVKFLRRWASDAGVAMNVQANLGGGMALGDPPLAIDGATLARFDVAIVDERSWAGLGAGARGALVGAARGGMGLLLRATGPIPDGVRGQWRALGFAVGSGAESVPVRLAPAAIDDAALGARRGIGTRDAPTVFAGGLRETPELTRRALAAGGVAIARDAAGAALAVWRPLGRGRVGLWTLDNSFALVTAGQGDRYAEMWSATFAALARPAARSPVRVAPPAFAGRRVTICGAGANATVVAPGGGVVRLLVDPAAAGCAGYWPRGAGWHLLRLPGGGAHEFYVRDPARSPGLVASETRDATLRLAVAPVARRAATAGPAVRGPAWPWFLGWLAVAGATWWFERSRRGRGLPVGAPARQ